MGVRQYVNELFGCFKLRFKAFVCEKSCLREQNKALKDTFFPIHFLFQSLKGLKTVVLNIKCHIGGGGGSVSKSVTYYLNGPKDEIYDALYIKDDRDDMGISLPAATSNRWRCRCLCVQHRRCSEQQWGPRL